MNIKFKKLVSHAMIPTKATEGSLGYDLFALDYFYDRDNDFHEFGTGLAISIPPRYVGLLFPRSSISKTGLMLANSVGVIDNDYIGEIKFRFKEINKYLEKYNVGDRVGQLLVIPCINDINFIETNELNDTDRGEGGFGSSGD